MALPEQWFSVQEDKTELDNVMNFLHGLPGKLSKLVMPENSNFLAICTNQDEMDITPGLFRESFYESREEFSISLGDFEASLR